MILAIDQGTTGTTCLVFDGEGRVAGRAYSEFEQHFPRPGWVEHDAGEIWEVTRRVAGEAIADAGIQGAELDGIGIANQRETVVAWDPATGDPIYRALVWQDRRTAERCDELKAAGREPLVRERTGLVIDPYFSGTKIEWLLRNVEGAERAVFGTVDSWLAFKLTGRHVTDYSNASRTMLFDIRKLAWDGELCAMLGVDPARLPEPLPSAHVYGTTSEFGGEVPVAGIAGDQQAALFGQACHRAGMAKNTYGTGSFVLLNTGEVAPPPGEGLLTTVACGELPPTGRKRHMFQIGGGGVCAGGVDLRHRRRRAVAARRAGDRRGGGADRGDGRLAAGQRRRLLRAGADRARLAAVGPVCARHDRRADPWHAARAPGPRGAGGDRLRDGRRGARPGGGFGRAAGGAEGRRRRGRQPLADAVPGRRAWGAGGRAGDRRDDGARRRLPGRDRDRALDAGAGGGDVARGGSLRAADGRGRARVAARRMAPRGRAVAGMGPAGRAPPAPRNPPRPRG